MEMEYDLTLAQHAYALAGKWDASRSQDVAKLDFKTSDLDSFDSNQKGTRFPQVRYLFPLMAL